MGEFHQDRVRFNKSISIEYHLFCLSFRNPNRGSFAKSLLPAQWQPYRANEHNYLYFQMKKFRTEPNYFDSMFQFWTECFQIENEGGCRKSFSINKSMGVRYFRTLAIVLSVLFGLLLFYFLGKYIQHRRKANDYFHPSLVPSYLILIPPQHNNFIFHFSFCMFFFFIFFVDCIHFKILVEKKF